MSSNYLRSIEAAKIKNGGTLPSDLYTQTNAQLGDILYNLTGDIKHKMGRTSKEALVKRVLKLTNSSVGCKRKADASDTSVAAPTAKAPRGCLSQLTHTQLAQMKRVMAISDMQLQLLKHDSDLRPLWNSIGMTSMYPKMTGKEKVMERLKSFAENNLRFHGHLPAIVAPSRPPALKDNFACSLINSTLPPASSATVLSTIPSTSSDPPVLSPVIDLTA